MYKQYIKQSLQMFRENPLVSAISVAGTALSIGMILVMVLVYQINSTGFSPESNRDRILYVEGTQAFDGHNRNRGYMSAEVLKECFYSLGLVEAVSGFSNDSRPLSLPGERLFKEYDIIYTDSGFWNIFDFRFLEGTSFSEADFQSGLPRMVISQRVASDLFGGEKAVGRTVVLDFIEYIVCGVVPDVASTRMTTYAQVWIPYTCNEEMTAVNPGKGENISGEFKAILMARQADDFDAIRAELDKCVNVYNDGKTAFKVDFLDNPISQNDKAMGSQGFTKVDWKEYLAGMGAFILLLLLIPSLNLIGVIQASVQKRKEEIGLRKAFGATTGSLLTQILAENLVTTLIGGLIGILLSFVLLVIGKSFLFNTEVMVLSADMLLKPGLFLSAFLFIFLMNLLSAGLPALRATRQPVVEALKGSGA